MADLLAQRLGLAGYCGLLRNLHAIYAALEDSLRRRARDPALAALGTAPLAREAALAADLDALHGPDWRAQLPVAPVTARYVSRLHELAHLEPPVWVAHAYVRYLGDLHGGQLLKRLVSRSLGVPAQAGTAFYDFGTDAQVQTLRDGFRRGLAQIVLSDAEADQIVAEARWAFEQHVQLFEHLAPAARASV